MKNKQIINYNTEGEYHGYQKWYWDNKLWFRCNFKNGRRIGYMERHGIKQTKFYII